MAIALLLAAREADAVLADLGLVALRQLLDDLVNLGHLAGLHDVLERGVRVGKDEVLVDGAGEQRRLLRHHAEVLRSSLAARCRMSWPSSLIWPLLGR